MVILGDNQITCLFYFIFSKLNYSQLDSLRFRLGPSITFAHYQYYRVKD